MRLNLLRCPDHARRAHHTHHSHSKILLSTDSAATAQSDSSFVQTSSGGSAARARYASKYRTLYIPSRSLHSAFVPFSPYSALLCPLVTILCPTLVTILLSPYSLVSHLLGPYTVLATLYSPHCTLLTIYRGRHSVQDRLHGL
jgi:hypothetical protein